MFPVPITPDYVEKLQHDLDALNASMAARGEQPFTLEEFTEEIERVWNDVDTWQPEGWPQ